MTDSVYIFRAPKPLPTLRRILIEISGIEAVEERGFIGRNAVGTPERHLACFVDKRETEVKEWS